MIRLWQHKKTGEFFKVSPWWECVENDKETIDLTFIETNVRGKPTQVNTKYGLIYQVGWLVNNKEGVWFGLSLDVQKHFEDYGPYDRKKDEKKLAKGTTKGRKKTGLPGSKGTRAQSKKRRPKV